MSYSDKQKIAYYKKLARANQNKPRQRRKRTNRTAKPRVKRDETTGIVNTLRDVGGEVGGLLGPLGRVGGSMLGNLIGEGVKFFTGRGDYQVRVNSLLNKGNEDMPPIINTKGVMRHGETIFRRSEYVSDVISSPVANTFKNDVYYVNPGLESTFQWLAQIAPNYEEYEIRGMYFEFRTMSADALNSVNTALGQVIMSANYNAASPAFASKQEMENYEGSVSNKPSASMRYFVECAKAQSVLSELYIRSGAVPTGQDQRFYDMCSFQIATNGLQGTSVNVGELWVSYEIALFKPKLSVALGNQIALSQIIGSAPTIANPLGTSWNEDSTNTLDLSLTATTITFPYTSVRQSYFMFIYWLGSIAASVARPTVSSSTATVTFVNQAPIPGNLAAGLSVQWSIITNANTTPVITFAGDGVYPTSGPNCYITITQIPNLALE